MADPSSLPPLPADHLSHPESWATGGDPATSKQLGFIKTLEKQHPDLVPANGLGVGSMGKSEASEVIDRLKKGEKVESAEEALEEKRGTANEPAQAKAEVGDESMPVAVDGAGQKVDGEKKFVEGDAGSKRKAPSTEKSGRPAKDADPEEEESDEFSGKDLKETKQTTLDGALGEGQPQSKKARKEVRSQSTL